MVKIPKWALKMPWPVISKEADRNGLDCILVASIIQTESGCRQYVARFEAKYRWLVRPTQMGNTLEITPETEEIFQKMSFGYMQIMGATARDLGFKGQLPELFDINTNIKYGCKYLKTLQDKYGDEPSVISSYNAGSPRKHGEMFVNESYVDKVYSYINQLR